MGFMQVRVRVNHQVLKQMIHGYEAGRAGQLIIHNRKPEYLPLLQGGDIVICPADVRHTPYLLRNKGRTGPGPCRDVALPGIPGTQANALLTAARKVFKGIAIYPCTRRKGRAFGPRTDRRSLTPTLPSLSCGGMKKDTAAAAPYISRSGKSRERSGFHHGGSRFPHYSSPVGSGGAGWFSVEWLRTLRGRAGHI